MFSCSDQFLTLKRPHNMTYFVRSATFCVIIFLVDGILQSDKPLLLTPYISHGRIAEARLFSLVKLPDSSTITSYSGFITVNETYNSNMFFWFVPSTELCFKNAPLLLWLQGGPGKSGLLGFFSLHGPYFLHANLTTGAREHAWTKRFSVIYVDNPVGTGFSFTGSEEGYSRTEDDVAGNLYEFLRQFFKMFPEYLLKDFYVTGESYAGKFTSALSYKIHEEGKKSKMPFRGMAIGSGAGDAEYVKDLSPYLYQLGLIDRRQASIIKSATDEIVQNVRSENYLQAYVEYGKLMQINGSPKEQSYLWNFTGLSFPFNYVLNKEPEDVNYFQTYVVKPEVRKAIHVGNLEFHTNKEVVKSLSQVIMRSTKPRVKVIMDNYRVMFYIGQLDMVVPYPATVNFLKSIDWRYAREYKEADRIIWRLNGDVAGYVHQVEDFYEVMVRNAGHLVPHDRPEESLDLITRFLCKRSFEIEEEIQKLSHAC